MRTLTPVFALLSIFAAEAFSAGNAVYSDSFRAYYPTNDDHVVLDRLEMEEAIAVWSDAAHRLATIRRTRGDRYPYENQKCLIEIDGAGLDEPRFISARGFRTVAVSWITGKLVLIELGIGRIAAVEAIYDVEQEDWVFRESVHYSD